MNEVTLNISSPNGAEQIQIEGERITIGRSDLASIVIANDAGLSRLHASIHREGDKVWIIDEQSTNGTYVNDRLVPAGGTALADGDNIFAGNCTIIKVDIKNRAQTEVSQKLNFVPSLKPPFIALVAAILLILLGFAVLYKATISSSTNISTYSISEASSFDRSIERDSSAVQEFQTAAQPAFSPSPLAQSSILSTDAETLPDAEALDAPVGRPKLYKKMSDEEKLEFIKRRAERIAIMMGKRPYAFTPDALKVIKFWLDAFAARVGNNRTGLWGGDTRFILERGKVHAPLIIRAFKERRVPPVVGLYIPFIETEYTNISANNFAGAAGLFQFLGPTAEHYGVPSAERTNVAKMSHAAAQYMRDNIMSFGDDSMSVALSIAGYNRAPESVKRDLRNVLNVRDNTEKERTFWTLIANKAILDEKFQNENANYVPRFFAAAIFGETPWAFGLDMRPLSTYTQSAGQPAPDPH